MTLRYGSSMPGAFNEEPLTPGASSERAASIMKTLQLSPQNGKAYLQAGGGLERLHQLRQSVDVLRTAVKLLPKQALAPRLVERGARGEATGNGRAAYVC